MNIRPHYFIETKDNLFFAVNTYYHPKNAIIAFLRYIPCDTGDRQHNGIKYKKVNSLEAYAYIKKVHSPIDRLNEIINDSSLDSPFYNKIRMLAEIFHTQAGISYTNMGITGSTLARLEKPETSDIDFIVFGLDNHKKARELYGKLKNDENSCLNKIEGDFWNKVYNKRQFSYI